MSEEKKKSKLADDPNPQLPPPPLSRARLAAKVEKVFEESLKAPATELAKAFKVFERVAAEGQAIRKSGRVVDASGPENRRTVKCPVGSNPTSSAKLRGRPPGKKPPKTLAERQQAFRDRKRGEKP